MISTLAKQLITEAFQALPKLDETQHAETLSLLKTALQEHLASTLKKMNLVSREEFDVQIIALKRAMETVKHLEKQVAELEMRYSDAP
jgi:ubiquinone biosynthesis accessory factor UbiK